MTLRDKVAVQVAHAIQGVTAYHLPKKGDIKATDEYYQNQANWINLATDAILDAVLEFLPEAVPLKSKYELSAEKGVYVRLGHEDKDEAANQAQLEYLSDFATDRGYNQYRDEVVERIKDLYRTKNKHHTVKKVD